ncbi:fibronectin type III domain-containing protein [Luteolibacter marinus]|uniref:fibronectin type III domain-containing protein n=1 Tax=Luteolibacter marinus TaxID=2776705 RepID=UPI0018685129|nr:fibronectin type III domain-containing protein [Luteolibacter marinus]
MNRSQFLRLSAYGAAGAFVFRPKWAMGAIDYDFQGTPAGLRPYLHAPRPDSIRVSWWTDSDSQTHVDYGLTAGNLDQTAGGGMNPLGANYHYHAARLTGLQPDTYYYYRVRTEHVSSQVFRFRTPKPLGTSTGKYRVLVLGDNQIIDPAQRRFERLVERAKKKVEDLYGVPIEEAVDLVIMPGDQVDVGTLEHYRHLHFKFNGWISPNVPIMTTIGNHETYSDPGLANYKAIFTYDDLDCLGVTSPDPEVYYAYQLANIAFVHTSSEHAGPPQTTWVQSLVNAAGPAPGIDWMISLCHRPYQAEQYIGDISNWLRNTAMPVLAQTEKHVLNIGAHHHIYARGQTREWPVYHIISGGSAWDQYWGQSNESDYDDVQKTIPNWAWQLIEFDLDARTMDVRCFAEANVKFPTSTRWSYNSRLIDRFSRKLGQAPPDAPALTNVFASPATLPLVLQSSPFSTTTGESLNSSWFQVATDAAFSDLKVDDLRDFENIYGDTGAPDYEPVDTRAGIDILQRTLAADGLANGSYFARVRHRDSNTLWSDWSPVVEFGVTGSSFTGDPAIRLEKSVFAPGEDIAVTYEGGPGLATDWIGIYKKGQNPGPVASTTWQYVTGTSGIRHFTTNLPAGEWFAAFFTNDGYTEIAPRVAFYVGDKPVLAPDRTSYDEGQTVDLSFSNAPGGANDWVGIYKEGTTPGAANASAWYYLNGTRTPGGAGTNSGLIPFSGLAKGYYFADYFLDDGYFGIAGRVRFSVGTEITQVSMSSPTVQPGADFTVNFTDGPGTPKDWMGIFKKGETPGIDVLTAYLYVDGNTQGSVTFSLPDLPPGDYFVTLFINDSYTEVSNRFYFSVPGNEALHLDQSSFDGSAMLLAWRSRAGVDYEIQSSTDLDEWEPVRTVRGTGSLIEETVTADPEVLPKLYFRLSTP